MSGRRHVDMVELYVIHTAFLDDEEIFKKRLNRVGAERRKKVLRYKTKEDKKRSLAAGLLLEHVLMERGYDPNLIEINEKGKPYLRDTKDFYFSISHSGEYAVCAVSNAPVGVDIQKSQETKQNIARRFFQLQEAEMIEMQPEHKRQNMFFRYWTGKESYLKLTGDGLTKGMNYFLVDLKQEMIVDPTGEYEKIYLKEYRCLENYYITVSSCSEKFASFVKRIYYRL